MTHLFDITDDDLPADRLFGVINQLLVAGTGEILVVDTQLRQIHMFDRQGN